MRMIPVQYMGFAVMDRRFSAPMMQWIIAEIKMRGTSEKMFLTIADGSIKGFSVTDTEEPEVKELVFQHPLHDVKKYSQIFLNNCTFLYLMLDPADHHLLNCFLYLTQDPQDVMELLTAMREQRDSSPARGQPAGPTGRSLSSASSLTSLCSDISLNSSHFFEVLYIGKVKVSHRKVPDSFIDDALEKFRLHDLEKGRLSSKGAQPLVRNNSNSRIVGKDSFDRRGSQDSSCYGSDTGSSENINHPVLQVLRVNTGSIEALAQPQMSLPPGIPTIALTCSTEAASSAEASSSDQARDQAQAQAQAQAPPTTDNTDPEAKPQQEWEKKEELEPMRSRAGSAGSALAKKPETTGKTKAEHNRTMLFLVGRTDLRLISPDRKQILLHKNLQDVVLCIQGVAQSDHFGFICREPNVDQYIGYVFKCQSESFADDVVAAITQSFQATNEHAKRDRNTPIFSCEHCPMVWYHKLCTELEGQSDKRVQQAIYRKLQQLPEEEQDVLLTKFRGSDNSNHARGLREQNEFLMMLIRAHCESKQSRHVHDTAENRSEFLNQYLGGSTIFMKAKRSLTSSFDHLLKRRGSRDDFGPMTKELSLPMNASICKEQDENGAAESHRPRSSTLGSSDMPPQASTESVSLSAGGSHPNVNAPGTPPQKGSPMMNIFLKMGNNPKTSPTGDSFAGEDVHRHSGSWRQAIFKTVVTPKKDIGEEKASKPKRTPEELRQLWKKAINQQVLLIRMEKENARIRARQEEKEVKRIKLEYDEIGSCVREVMEVWDLLDSKENRFNARCDNPMLIQAIRQGVPRSKRGDVWHYLAEQFCLKAPPIDLSKFPNYNVPYEHLLKQLTSHQHAILIDLGRTFPNHAYFSSPLGPGQLALFNILKAYSLLDPEVGYCQGLSFVAGVLLLHMSEDNAFFLLRHLMFRRGLRRQYLPDMAALHVHLYQLSRLLHDQLPELFCHLDRHEVTATLYAAPWMLTLFASQFPLGFVTRVFDLLFVESPEVIFRVSIALMIEHKEGLMDCGSFEEIIDYLKIKVPLVDKNVLDRVLKKVFTMDISKQLNEYEVEYHVLQEEQSTPRPEAEKLKALTEENRALLQQIEITTSNLKRLETTRAVQQAQMNRLESQIRSLEVSINTLGGFIATLTETHKDIEIPGDVRRLVAQLTAPQPDRRKNSGNLGLGNIFKHNEHANLVPPKQEHSVVKYELPKQSKSDPPTELPRRRAFPLKVIEDDESFETHTPLQSSLSLQSGATLNKVKSGRPYPLKSAMSSPNLTAKVSSLFGQNHERNHMDIKEKSPTGNGISPVLREDASEAVTLNQKDDSRKKDGSFIDVPLGAGEVASSRESQPDGRKPPLRKDEIMKQLEAVVNTKLNLTENLVQDLIARRENMENAFEESVTSGKCHPLDSCSDVSFSYGGTTKLKTIRPLRAQLSRNATIATIDTDSFVSNHEPSTSPSTERKGYEVISKGEECQNVPLPNEQQDLL